MGEVEGGCIFVWSIELVVLLLDEVGENGGMCFFVGVLV